MSEEPRAVSLPIVRREIPLSVPATIEYFFREPHPADRYGDMSTLQVLRQELLESLFAPLLILEQDAATGRAAESRVFTSAILISTGIDLLAKLWKGDDAIRESAERFRTFVQQYFRNGPRGITEEEAEALYAFRCSLVHSFALYDSRRRFQFHLDLSAQAPIEVQDNETTRAVTFAVHDLYLAFLAACAAYRDDLASNADLQAKFVKMFEFYGSLVVLPNRADE